MPIMTFHVLLPDYLAAERIATKMQSDYSFGVSTADVIALAATTGMDRLREIWNDTEDQANAYADAKIRADKLARNEGRPDGDLNTYGTKLEPGT